MVTPRVDLKAYVFTYELDQGAFGFPEASFDHFYGLMKYDKTAGDGLVSEYMDQIPVAAEKSKKLRVGDFSPGPYGSFVISRRVMEALPQRVRDRSFFTKCAPDSSQNEDFFCWILRIREPFIDAKQVGTPKRITRAWDYHAIEASNETLARDAVLATEWICISLNDGSFDFKATYEENGWSGLEFSENLEKY